MTVSPKIVRGFEQFFNFPIATWGSLFNPTSPLLPQKMAARLAFSRIAPALANARKTAVAANFARGYATPSENTVSLSSGVICFYRKLIQIDR